MRTSLRTALLAATAALALVLTACGAGETDTEQSAPAQSPAPTEPTTEATEPENTEEADDEIIGTVIRFTSGETSVNVTVDEDNPAVRDFLSMLPLELSFEEYAGEEKISYLPRELDYEGSPASDLTSGDLLYFVPWGNLGFWYADHGNPTSEQTIHLGTFDASLEELIALEGDGVIVEALDDPS